MKTTISDAFFSVYSFGGLMDNCIDILRERYNLQIYPTDKKMPKKWQEHYNETLPRIIEARFNEFDESIITNCNNNSLFNEIENNILELNEAEQQKRYIHSILSNFKKLSDMFYPNLSDSDYYQRVAIENDKLEKFWENANDKKEAKKQLEAIKKDRIRREDELKRLIFISDEFRKIRQKNYARIDIIEKVFNSLLLCKEIFTNRLDAILLKHKLDLLEIQKECNIYLKTGRNVTDVDFYLGSIALAERYINELPQTKNNNGSQKQKQEQEQEQEQEEDEGNDFRISTIRECFYELREDNTLTEDNCNILVGAIETYLQTGKFPTLKNRILLGRVNKKRLGWCFNEALRFFNKGISIEVLEFAKQNISTFNTEKLNKDNYRTSNLYKYFTTKTH